ncbi:MAG: substrate-binding domain-containing protein, partial [Desulfomonilaceae bacterium]
EIEHVKVSVQILVKALCLTVALYALFACNAGPEKPDRKAQPEPKRKFKIATLVKVDGIPWFARMRVGVDKFAWDTGQESFSVGPARADGALQGQMVDELVKQGVNAICIVPFSTSAVEAPLKRARDKGIIVVAQEGGNLQNADAIIEPFEGHAWGRHLMDELAASMRGQGDYAIILGSYHSQSHMGWRNAAVSRQLEKYPEMRLVTEALEDHDNAARSYAQAKELLTKFPYLKGILGLTMVSCPSSALAVETMGLLNKVSVVGVSLVSACKSYLESGSIKEISFWDPAEAGYAMNEAALKLLQGQKIVAGTDLKAKGYRNLRQDRAKSNLFYGQGWIDVTKKNMADYPY